jgi:hypothetical protein
MTRLRALGAGALIALSAAARAQTLSLATVEAAAGEKTAIAVFFEAAKTGQTVALQWEIAYPSQVLEIQAKDIVAGDAARAAGKSVQCAGERKKDLHSYRCVLFGGSQPIGSGSVAVLHATVNSAAKPGRHGIKLEAAIAVAPNLKRAVIKDSQTSIVVR